MVTTKSMMTALAVVVAVSACASATRNQGKEFSMATADAFRPGVTTQQDAIAQLGPPESIQATANGGHRLAWQYVKSTATAGLGSVKGASIHEGIAIVFNADGIMDHVDKRLQRTGSIN